MNNKITTLDEYYMSLSDEAVEVIGNFQEQLMALIPNYQEKLSYQLPCAIYKGKYMLYFGAFKKHWSIFLGGGKALELFGTKIPGSTLVGKTIQMGFKNMVPQEILKEIVQFKMNEIDVALSAKVKN